MTSSLDLNKLLQVNSCVSLFASLGHAPPYNLPIFLYGLATAGTSNEHLLNLTGLLAVSFIGDILWLILWRHDYTSFTAFLLLVTMAIKAITFLVTQTNKPFAGFGEGESGQTIWSMPGGFSSRANEAPNAGSYQGYRFADEEDDDVPASANSTEQPRQADGPKKTANNSNANLGAGQGYQSV